MVRGEAVEGEAVEEHVVRGDAMGGEAVKEEVVRGEAVEGKGRGCGERRCNGR